MANFPFAMGPVEPGGIMDQMQTLLQDPRTGTALANAGVSLMGVPGWGMGPTAQIAEALGRGGEAVRSVEAQDLKKQEAESKQDLRAAQANAAEARAGAAGARADSAGARLELGKAQEQGRMDRNLLNARMRLSAEYNRYVSDAKKRNAKGQADILQRGKFQPEDILGPEDWVKQNAPGLKLLMGDAAFNALSEGAGSGGAGQPTKPGTPATYAPLPTSKGDLKVGEIYQTKQGPGKWNGTDFDPVGSE